MVEEAEVDAAVAVGDVTEVDRLLEPLRVRRGVNMEKNFLTPCWPLGCDDGEEEELVGCVGCAATGVLAGGEVGEVGISDGGGVSTAAAAVDAAALLEPDVKRLNIARRQVEGR